MACSSMTWPWTAGHRYENLVLDRVHAVPPGRVLIQANDAGHAIIARLADVVVDGDPEVRIAHRRRT
jgi:hypothetical protein